MKAWMRVLTIVLKSKKFKKQFVFSNDKDINETSLNITCTLNKYMSTLKDSATITIDNLTPNEISQIMIGEFYDIEIWAGYKGSNICKIFDGGVLWLSNKLNSNDRTTTLIILAASQLVARYGQSRLNLSLNSGINIYSAIKFICKMASIPNSNVSTQFKKQFIEHVVTVNDTAANWLDKLAENNNSIIGNSDSILEQTFSIFDSAKSNSRVIKLKNSDILLTGGYPKLTNQGVNLNLLPTFNFICGDTIEIDNSILDISVTDRSQISKNYGAYFSEKGQYMIIEMTYNLETRGNNFTLQLKCKNRDRISAYVGGSNEQ